MRSLVRVGMFLVVAAGAALGCQSGAGEHCQVNSDCASGYVCTSLGFCDTTNTPDGGVVNMADARPDSGATTPDAAGPDANTSAIDASADAPILVPDAQ